MSKPSSTCTQIEYVTVTQRKIRLLRVPVLQTAFPPADLAKDSYI